jgi:hypothetical protein
MVSICESSDIWRASDARNLAESLFVEGRFNFSRGGAAVR